ncbi:MAG TPA: hypothetical protein VF659_08120 [Pyrinomonadaceae bacterium]
MRTLHLRITVLTLALSFCAGAVPPARAQEAPREAAAGSDERDCQDDLTVGVSAGPHVINPSAPGRSEAGITVSIRPCPTLPAGTINYTLEVVNKEGGRAVYAESRTARAEAGGVVRTETAWRPAGVIADGRYAVRVTATLSGAAGRRGRALAGGSGEDEVVVDRAGALDKLFAARPAAAAESLAAEPVSPHDPLAQGFPFRYFYGSTHAHTIWSDGGVPVDDCDDSVQVPHEGADPAAAYRFAREQGRLDFLAVVEHNHLMQNVCAGCSAQQVRERYHGGVQAARDATVADEFVGVFGMEWGVIANKQGHLNIYNQENLISWSGEPSDIQVVKGRYDQVYNRVAQNQGDAGSFITFNHPKGSDFNNWERTAQGDRVVRGLAILSGPAFSNGTDFGASPGNDFEGMYRKALGLGWKVGPEVHQDNHCANYGASTSGRTVALIPQGTAFDLRSLMDAYRNRRIYATEDVNAQLVFRRADGGRVMGESFGSSAAAVRVRIEAHDPDGEPAESVELWGGRVGSTQAPQRVAGASATDTLDASIPRKPAGQEWWYYVKIRQADGDRIWSSPVWIRWN